MMVVEMVGMMVAEMVGMLDYYIRTSKHIQIIMRMRNYNRLFEIT